MNDQKKHELSEAMIDETLAESFPASDPPAWTLGVADDEPAILAPKGSRYLTREAVLSLLSDDEIARVARLEGGQELCVGEEYLDLAQLERGLLRVEAGRVPDASHALPRSALSDETWAKIVTEARRGWQRPDST